MILLENLVVRRVRRLEDGLTIERNREVKQAARAREPDESLKARSELDDVEKGVREDEVEPAALGGIRSEVFESGRDETTVDAIPQAVLGDF